MNVWGVLSGLLFYAGAAAAYYVSRRMEAIREDRRLQLCFLGWCGATGTIFARAVVNALGPSASLGDAITIPFVLLICVGPGGALYALLFARGFSALMARLFGFPSVEGMTLEKTHDRADAAEKQKQYDDAETLYSEAIDEDPDDLVGRRKRAEVLLKEGKVDEALAEFRRLAELVADPEARALLLFRTADLLVHHKGQPERAAQMLEYFAAHSRSARWAGLARQRAAKLRQRAGLPPQSS